jgi:hypothetical protein
MVKKKSSIQMARARGMTSVVGCLHGKCEVLSSSPRTGKTNATTKKSNGQMEKIFATYIIIKDQIS